MPSEFDEFDAILAAPSAATAAAPVQTPAPAPVRQAEPSEFAEFDSILSEPVKQRNTPLSVMGQIGLAGRAAIGGLNQAITDVYPQAVAGILRGKNVPLRDTGFLDRTIAEQEADMASKSLTPQEQETKVFGVRAGTIEGGLKNLGYSGAVMVPQAIAQSIGSALGRHIGTAVGGLVTAPTGPGAIGGAAAGGAVGGAIGGQALGIPVGYVTAKRADINQVLRQKREQLLAANPSMTEAEWEGVKQQVDAAVEKHGAAEGGWEAVGNAIQLAIMGLGAKWGAKVPLPPKLAKTLGVIAGTAVDVPMEVASEAKTQQAQTEAERSMGLREPGAPLTFTEAVGEVGPQTLVTTAATMGLGGTISAVRRGFTPEQAKNSLDKLGVGDTSAAQPEATLDPETEALIVKLQEEQALEAERAARPATPLPPAPGIGGHIAPEGAPVTPEAELDAVLQGAGADIRADNRAQDAAARVEQEQGAISDIDAIKAKVAADKQALRQRVAELVAQRQVQTPSSGLQDNAIEGEVPAPHVQPASVSTPINSKTVAFDDVTKASDKNPYFIHITTPEAAKQILADRRIKAGQRGAFFWENGLDGASAEVMSEWLPDSPFVYIAIPKQGVSVAPDSWVKTGDAVVAGQDVALPPGTLVSSVETESNQKPDFNTLDAPPPPAEPAQGSKPPDSAQGIGGEPGSGEIVSIDVRHKQTALGVKAPYQLPEGKHLFFVERGKKRSTLYPVNEAGERVVIKDVSGQPLSSLSVDNDSVKSRFTPQPIIQRQPPPAEPSPAQVTTQVTAQDKAPSGNIPSPVAPVKSVESPSVTSPPAFTGKVYDRNLDASKIRKLSYMETKDAAKGSTWSDGRTVWDSAKGHGMSALKAELIRHRAAYMPSEDQEAIRKASVATHLKRSAAARRRVGVMSDKEAMERAAAQEMDAVRNGKDAPIDEQDMSDGGYVRIGERWFRVSVPEDGRGKTLTAANGEKIVLDLGESTDGKVAIPANSPNHAAIDAEFKAEVAATPQVPAPKIENDPFADEREDAPALTLESQTPEQVKAERAQAEAKAAKEALANKPPSKPLDTTGDMFDQSKAENPLFAVPPPKVKPAQAAIGTRSTGIPRSTYDTAVASESRVMPMGERAQAFDRLEDAPSDVRSAVAGGTAYVLGKDTQGQVRAVTIGDRSYFFLDRYANEGEIRQDIREEFFHRIENEYAGYGKASTLGTLTYGGKWSGIKNEITRNYGLRPGQEGFFRELAAKAYRDGLTDRTVWGKFLDAIVATVKATARRMGVKLDLSDAEIRDHVNGVLRAKVEATQTQAMEPKAQFARGEAPVTPDNITRINKDTITAEREAKGYGPQPERVPVSDEALMQQANDAIAADKSLMDRTVDDFSKEMRVPQTNELGILVRAKKDRRVELDKANADLDSAEKANDPAALKAARDRWEYANKRDREITKIFSVGGVGSQAGLLLQKFRIAIDDDFSVVHLQRSVEAKQGWKPLNAKQKASLADIAKQYQNGERIVQERMAEHEAEVSKLRESRDIADELLTLADQELQDARLNEAFLRDVLNKMPEPDMSVPVSKTIQNDAKAAGQAARERMKARRSSVIDAEMLKDAFDVGYEFFIEEAVNLKASAKPKAGQQALFARGEAQDGVNPAWAEKMVAIYGEQIRPRLQEIQDAARKRFGYQQGLEAAKVRKPAAPRQPAPRKPGNILDRAEITEMFKDQAKAGVRDGKVALENVSRIVQEVYPDVSSEQVRDIFTGKDKEKGREPDLIVKATGDMRRQLQTITNIERLGKLLHPILFGPKRTKPSATARELMRKFNKLFKQAVKDGTLELDQDALDARRASALDAVKTRMLNRIEQLKKAIDTKTRYTVNNTPIEYDAATKDLIAQRDALQTVYDEMFPPEPLTYEQRVEQAVKATDRAIAAQQQKVDEAKAGKFKDTATGRASLWSPAIGERKLTLQALRDAYDELELAAFPPPTALQKAIDTKRKRYETATKEFNRRLREKDFAKRQVPHVDISGDKAALDALEQMGIAKARFLHEKRRAAWMEMGKWGKVGTLVGAVWDTSRDVLSSGELSAIGRQGYPAFFINPHAWIKANRAMFRSLSRKSSMAVVQEFKQRKNYTNGFYKRGRLPISEDDGRGNYDKMDDRIKANIVNHIPILGASNRAYAAFLNNLRAELFDWLLAQHDSALNPSDALLREIGDNVGILTGKGRLGGSSEALQRVVYAPSFFKSSLDIITGKPVLGTSDKQLKWMMAKAYGKLLAGTGMIALLATIMGGGDGDDETEWNMTSSDFGMVDLGHYKVGLFGFVRPLLTFLARQMTGYMKTDKGKVRLVDTLPPWTNPQGIAPKVRQGQDIDQVNWRFIKSKLHPAISGVSAASTGRDFGGSPISREKAIMEMFTPITWKDLSEASKIETLDMMVLLTILMAAGFDVRMDYNDPVVKRYLDSKKKL